MTMFLKNLSAFLAGLACQVLSGIFPKLAGVLLGPATLLLSLADVRAVLNGSFAKHVTIFAMGISCQVFAVLAPDGWNVRTPLLAAGGILMSASDIKRVLKGPEVPTAPLVTPEPGTVASLSNPNPKSKG